jgi:hypothetical protein
MKRITLHAVLGAALLLLTAQAGFAAASLSVNGTAKIVGNFGLEVIIPSKGTVFGDSAYVQSAHPSGESHFKARFWIDVADMTIPNTVLGQNYFRFMYIAGTTPNFVNVVGFITKSLGSGNYRIIYWTGNDALGYEFAGGLFLTSGATPLPAQIEVEWTKATGVGANNGVFKMTNISDSGNFAIKSNIDSDTLEVDDVYIGYHYAASNAAISGSYDSDEWESYR